MYCFERQNSTVAHRETWGLGGPYGFGQVLSLLCTSVCINVIRADNDADETSLTRLIKCPAHKFSYRLAITALPTTSAATTPEGGICAEQTHPVGRALGRG